MVAKPKKKLSRKVNFAGIHRFSAAVSLLAFLVIVIAGIMSETRFITITFRSIGVVLMISVVTRVITQILASYEEMNSGKA
jgi:hypothetical protein